MRFTFALTFGGTNQVRLPLGTATGATMTITPTLIGGIATGEENELALIDTFTPGALASEIEIPLTAGYLFYEVRWAGLGLTASGSVYLTVSFDGVTWDAPTSYIEVDGGGHALESGGMIILAPGAALTRYGIVGSTTTNHLTGVVQKVKLHPFTGAVDTTFTGTGTAWLHGIPS